jgi:hypothetical protein
MHGAAAGTGKGYQMGVRRNWLERAVRSETRRESPGVAGGAPSAQRGAAVALVACVLAAVSLWVTPTAGAYKRINSLCILRAEKPYWGGGSDYVVEGEVDCTEAHQLVQSTIEVCAQVHNANGNWYTVSGSCVKHNEYGAFNYDANYVAGVNGHEYRTWDKGWLPEFGQGAEYESAGFTCGCP